MSSILLCLLTHPACLLHVLALHTCHNATVCIALLTGRWCNTWVISEHLRKRCLKTWLLVHKNTQTMTAWFTCEFLLESWLEIRHINQQNMTLRSNNLVRHPRLQITFHSCGCCSHVPVTLQNLTFLCRTNRNIAAKLRSYKWYAWWCARLPAKLIRHVTILNKKNQLLASPLEYGKFRLSSLSWSNKALKSPLASCPGWLCMKYVLHAFTHCWLGTAARRARGGDDLGLPSSGVWAGPFLSCKHGSFMHR